MNINNQHYRQSAKDYQNGGKLYVNGKEQANAEKAETLQVSRELDGVNDTGVVGELLTIGTKNLAEANKYFAMGKFTVSGLLAEDNQAVSSPVEHLTSNPGNAYSPAYCDVLGEDDMYVAGDPGVGGKGNQYAFSNIDVNPGYYTMFEDGQDAGRKITVNAHVDTINPEGNKAFTEYGFILQDEAGAKTRATLSGGQLTVVGEDGVPQRILPPNGTYTVGDPNDPTAKFYYEDAPGAGANGASEKRLMMQYYEKPTQATIDQLTARGVSVEDAAKLRTTSRMSFGFRVPDGLNTFALPEGVGAGNALKVAANGVKTYYDAHFYEETAPSVTAYSTPYTPTPAPTPSYPPVTEYPTPTPAPTPAYPEPEPVAANEKARLWGDPHLEDADGGKYDFQEAGIYNVLADQNLALNAQLEKGPNNTTLATAAGLTLGNRTLQVNGDGKAVLGYNDGYGNSTDLLDGQSYDLGQGAKVSRSGNKITVDSQEYQVLLETALAFANMNYLNMDVTSKAQGVQQDGVAPTGLLGETFDADKTAQTGLKQDPAAYRQDSLLTPAAELPLAANSKKAISASKLNAYLQQAGYGASGAYGADELRQAATDTNLTEGTRNLLTELANQSDAYQRNFSADDLVKIAGADGRFTKGEVRNLATTLNWPATNEDYAAETATDNNNDTATTSAALGAQNYQALFAQFMSWLQQMMGNRS